MPSTHENEALSPRVEDEDPAQVPRQNMWQTVWENNKGALLVLLSELCSSTSDAVARYLQQSGAGFHTLQVGIET